MGIFGNIFGGKSNAENLNSKWNIITSELDLDKLEKESYERKVVIFKHSTRCFISKTVLKSFEKQMDESDRDISFYFLDLLANRGISNEIENRYNITHQSPQVIVLENGEVVYNASHHLINLESVS